MRLGTILVLPLSVAAQQYRLQDDYAPSTFGSQFKFFTDADPTHGYVNYVSEAAASSSGLFSTTQSSVHLGVDSANVVSAGARGRDSIRLESVKTYNAGTLFILDATHMPVGCGTWPAFWLYGPNWPSSGEIDIIEGVNNQGQNSFAAHTNAGCTVSTAATSSGSQAFLGQLSTSNCDVNAAGQATNAGCGIVSSQGASSYGAGFNANNGGVYATEWANEAISIWFFPRGSLPSDVTSGNPNPASWGIPQARFGTPSCDINQHFKDQSIVINTALCGDWAGGVWSQDSTCSAKASTCQEFVQNNPTAFQDAYWEISSLKVYQANGGASASTTLAATSTAQTTITATASTFSTVVVTSSEVVTSTATSSATTSAVTGTTSAIASLPPPVIPTSALPTTSAFVPTILQTTPAAATTAETTTPAAAPSSSAWSGWPGNGGGFGGGDRPAWAGSGYGGRGGRGGGGAHGPPRD